MGGHGGLNILPQKRWHVYNQDNREKVLRDELAFEEVQKAKRAKFQKAESEYRHALLLARARQEPLDVAAPRMEDFLGDAAASAAREVPEQAQLQPEAQDASRQDARVHVPAAAVLPSRAGQVLPLPPPRAGGPGVAGSSGKREPDRHFNFWKEDELKLGNAEVKADQVNERRRRGDAATQTSDARFDEKFQLGHNMHGRANTPWYAAGPAIAPPAQRPVDGAALLAAAQQGRLPGTAAAAELMAPVRDKKNERKGKSKGKSKRKYEDKAESKDKKRRSAARDKLKVDESKLRLTAAQLKASVQAMRKERIAREEQERLREKQLLRTVFRL